MRLFVDWPILWKERTCPSPTHRGCEKECDQVLEPFSDRRPWKVPESDTLTSVHAERLSPRRAIRFAKFRFGSMEKRSV